MRNLKRALSLALAAVMVMSMMVIGAGAASLDDFSDKDEIVNKEAVTVLSTLNVINGKDDGSYDPTGIVTRAEMSKIICVILNGGKDPALGASTTHTYTDTVNHWAESYIEYCTQLGIVAGKGNGTFDPNGTVTATEAAKMLLVALGYNASFENMVGSNWAISTNVLANQNKLYAGLDIDVDAGLTRDNAAQMAYNALNCEMVAYTYALVTGADGSLTSIPRVENKDDTLLSDKFGGVRVEGVVVRNEQTAANFDGKTRIEITNGDELTKVGHNFGSTATFEVTTDASLLGTSVFFYAVPSVASPTNSEKAMVLGSVMDSGKNTVVTTTKTFGSDGIEGFMKDEDIDVNDSTAVYVDGSLKTNGKDGIAETAKITNKTGWEVKFIDNDNDGITESVVQTQYGFGKVTRYSTKDDGSLTIDTYPDSKDYKSAKVVGFEDVALNDYVVYNTMGGKLYVAKAETVTGTLETFKTNSDRLKANLTVDGTSYTFSELDYNKKDGELERPDTYLDGSYMGKEITLYMDKFGYVAAVSEVQGFTDYAYIANASANNDASGMAGSVRVYAVLADGTEASYVIDELDDARCTGVGSAKGEVTIGNIYGYYVNSEGKIDLTTVTNDKVSNSTSITYDKGDATISGSAMKVDSSTVFFYGMLKNGSVDSVEVYIGKDSAPSVKMTTDKTYKMTTVDKDADGIADAVLFVTDKVTSSNILYLYQYVKSTSDKAIYNAVIDGKLVEGITVDDKATDLAPGVYSYTITSKDYYSLTKNPATTVSDFVALVDGKSVVLDNGIEVKITDSTSMAEIDGSDTAIITNVSKKDYVTVVYNASTGEATGIYIVEAYSTDNASVLGTKDADVVSSKLVTTYTNANTVLSNLIFSKSVADKFIVSEADGKTISDYKGAVDAKAKAETTLSTGIHYVVTLAEDGASYGVTKLTVNAPDTATKDITLTVKSDDASVSDYAATGIVGDVLTFETNATATQTVVIKVGDADVTADGYKLTQADFTAGKVTVTWTVSEDGYANTTGSQEITLTQTKAAAPSVSFTNTGSGSLADNAWTTVANGDKLSITVDMADGQTATVKVAKDDGATGTITTDFETGKAVTDNSATEIYTAGTSEDGTLTITVTVSQNGYADWTQNYEVTINA